MAHVLILPRKGIVIKGVNSESPGVELREPRENTENKNRRFWIRVPYLWSTIPKNPVTITTRHVT